MTDTPDPRDVQLQIGIIISTLQDAMFERFDNLHKRGIHDNDVVHALRSMGEADLADSYIEWADIVDPDKEDDNTTTNPTVPDPSDAHSYSDLGKLLERNALNAYLRSDEMKRFGARDYTLRILKHRLPVGTRVAYWPGSLAGEFTEAVTSSEVWVSAGMPVVSLASGRQAVALTSLQVIG